MLFRIIDHIKNLKIMMMIVLSVYDYEKSYLQAGISFLHLGILSN
jgi:hypothetical protein